MFFSYPDDFKEMEHPPGARGWIVWGGKLMLHRAKMEPNQTGRPYHSHEAEQIAVILEGEMEMDINGEVRKLKQGDAFYVPPNVKHRGKTFSGQCILIECFTPPREDYK